MMEVFCTKGGRAVCSNCFTFSNSNCCQVISITDVSSQSCVINTELVLLLVAGFQ